MIQKNMVQARYIEQAVLEYRGNPLIEALPPILSEEAAAEAMANFPEIPSETERQGPKEIRLHNIDRLNRLVQPLPIYLEMENVVSTIIRSGYVGRNPMSTQTWRHLYGLSAERGIATEFASTASTFSLVGLSGIGKSTMLNSILKLYPQIIRHQKYHNTEFIHTQITYIKLDCPHDGSLTGLCRAFLRAVDIALAQDRYTSQLKSKVSVPELIQKMEQVASTYFIGALFIDELQHLNSAKTGGKENMLNFFVNMINSIGIPVAFIGTNSMVNLFSDVMRNARRASGLGKYEFEQPKEDDPIWDLLLDAVWDYQWIKYPQPLNVTLRHKLYDLTQGVTDFLAKLMILSQRHAIQTGKETLTPDILNYIADTKMALLKPAISALRSGDPKQMKRFDDLLPTDEQLKAMMEPTDEEVTLARLDVLSKTQPRSKLQNSSANVAPKKQEIGLQQPLVQTAPEAIELAQQPDPMGAMQEAGWLLQDPFEFSTTYRKS